MPRKTSEVKNKVDPAHYKGFVNELQWIETMARIPRYRKNPSEFIAALELQVRKYIDRDGKDISEVEYRKGLFYYMFLVAYLSKGTEAKAETVQAALAALDG
jgi:hypothetical protein